MHSKWPFICLNLFWRLELATRLNWIFWFVRSLLALVAVEFRKERTISGSHVLPLALSPFSISVRISRANARKTLLFDFCYARPIATWCGVRTRSQRFRPFYWFNDKVFMINYDNAFQKCIKYFCQPNTAHGWDVYRARARTHFATHPASCSFSIECSMDDVQFQNETWPDDAYTGCCWCLDAATVLRA